MSNLKNYRKIVGDDVVEDIYKKASKLSGKHIVYISSTHQGGGVAEILNSIVFLFNEVGIDLGWRIIHGSSDFFSTTKKIHNAMQGDKKLSLSSRRKKIYEETNKRFSVFTHLPHDLVVVHDPQPLPLIQFYKKRCPWIFRSHIDMSNPNRNFWNYLKNFIKQYDHLIVSKKDFRNRLNMPTNVIYPAIDPLSSKNRKLSEHRMNKCLEKHGIDLHKPIISQVSRFDRWKDPEGVVKVFKKVRKKIDCQLVLLGNLATDDPEGIKVYEKIRKKYEKDKNIKLLLNVPNNDLTVNSLQSKSSVVIQKSIKEGFGLVVSESLYKGTPVVASNVGGIPFQVIDGFNGFLHEPGDINNFSESVLRILKDEKLKEELGQNAREHVKRNFLITRLMNDWLDIFGKYL